MAGASGVALAVVMTLAMYHVRQTTRSFTYPTIEDVPFRDVAIVPGVGTASRKMPRHLRERLSPALALYRAGKVRSILVSGIGVGPARDEVSSMVRWLLAQGVAPEHIMSDPAGHRTLDTMQRATKLLDVTSAIVCTQGVFLPRALFLARAAGIDAVGLPAPSPIYMSGFIWRSEALKSVLALVDTYVTDRGPRYDDMHGALIRQPGPNAPTQPAAFSFLTSPISAGMTVSQLPTRP
ncbi:MAG: ElyC/SanA/YdcF family protein [Myxococcales bacterium]